MDVIAYEPYAWRNKVLVTVGFRPDKSSEVVCDNNDIAIMEPMGQMILHPGNPVVSLAAFDQLIRDWHLDDKLMLFRVKHR